MTIVGREFSFKKLFDSTHVIYNVEITLKSIAIPRIQRDYAQGRENSDVKKIRDKFLKALIQAFINDDGHITLDFIYGDLKDGVLSPLDGQQRLTTLFLLYWYIAKKEKVDKSEYAFLKNFSYETRTDSREFCKELVEYSPDFSKCELSGCIRNQPWYQYGWKNDPTIQSMLVMLDSIHGKFEKQPDLWGSLEKKISFYFIPLENMGLTDDLYIKMNSRGKPLTQFEEFKGEFEKIIKTNIDEEHSKKINCKIDKEWSQMLFPFRDKEKNIIDYGFMRYFRLIGDILCYQAGIKPVEDEYKLANTLYGEGGSKENLEYLENSFDCWCGFKITAFFNEFFTKDTYESGKVRLFRNEINLFGECCMNRNFPLNYMLLLFSIITYLQKKDSNKISKDVFRKRIRIIRNLIMNSEISENRMNRLLYETEEIILGRKIPASERGNPGYNEKQKEEEREKIVWLEDNPEMEDELFHLEDHNLLRGSVAVVGLENKDNFEKFSLLFDYDNKLVERALLSLGDYTQSIYYSKKFFTGLTNTGYIDNWIRLFHHSEWNVGFDKTKTIINKLLRSINDDESIEDELNKIISDYLNNEDTIKDWRYYFVKYHKSLNESGDGYYEKFDNTYGYDIIKLNRIQHNGKNWNVYLYLLQKEDKKNLALGEYYYYYKQNLKIKNTDIAIDCTHDRYIVYNDDVQTEHQIKQSNGIDMEDRIERGKEIIKKLKP